MRRWRPGAACSGTCTRSCCSTRPAPTRASRRPPATWSRWRAAATACAPTARCTSTSARRPAATAASSARTSSRTPSPTSTPTGDARSSFLASYPSPSISSIVIMCISLQTGAGPTEDQNRVGRGNHPRQELHQYCTDLGWSYAGWLYIFSKKRFNFNVRFTVRYLWKELVNLSVMSVSIN